MSSLDSAHIPISSYWERVGPTSICCGPYSVRLSNFKGTYMTYRLTRYFTDMIRLHWMGQDEQHFWFWHDTAYPDLMHSKEDFAYLNFRYTDTPVKPEDMTDFYKPETAAIQPCLPLNTSWTPLSILSFKSIVTSSGLLTSALNFRSCGLEFVSASPARGDVTGE